MRLARCVVDDKWPLRRAAERFQVSPSTAKRWADRYRAEGVAGMTDRSSRPHTSPNRTPRPIERRVLHLRRSKRLGPVRIGWRLGLPASTCHAILRRAGAVRLAHLDRATAEPIRRYEHGSPGDLIHVDIKKLGNGPDPHPLRHPVVAGPVHPLGADHEPRGIEAHQVSLPAVRPDRLRSRGGTRPVAVTRVAACAARHAAH
ncbi:helix-turn-helix domain-containing protein [Actinoplanes sp. NEAU-A11]|uniref:Helix-turn-helix domain-containing protein n=1 Tax=Actinoplanes aureus TaxID=2792083 RepID=A0A931CLJ4_9ACTN|nr:helix-turn-helix domain-containing protein [Actinoplanes aureus]